MADANLTLLTRADLAPITNATTGRVAFTVKDTAGATAATIELGYTGVMDVTSLATGISSGTVELWRNGNTTTLNFLGVKPIADGTLKLFDAANALPSGFRTSSFVGGEEFVVPTAAASIFRRGNWNKNGLVTLYNVLAADNINGSVKITTATAWPAALIGVSKSSMGWV